MRLEKHLVATIYDQPGKWMSEPQLQALRADLRAVAQAAIPGDLTYGVFRPDRAPYETRLIVVGRDTRTGAVAGFNAMPRLQVQLADGPITVLHLGLMAIHPDFQRRGLQGLLYGLGGFSCLHRIPERRVWVSNVTEVPSVAGAFAENFLEAYPGPLSVPPPPPRHREIAMAIARDHRHEFGVGPEAAFDDQRFVLMGSYVGGSEALKKTFDKAPKHRDPRVNDFCQRELDYGRGDDFLQIGQVDVGVISAWMARRLPAELRPQAARKMRLWTYPTPRKSAP